MTRPSDSISVDEYRTLVAQSRARKNKFNAKRVTNGQESFDSTGEARRYAILEQQQRYGLIFDLKRQVAFPLYCGDKPLMLPGKTTGKATHVRYLADFVYRRIQGGTLVIEDFKGHDTIASRLKRAILATMTDAEIIVTRKPSKSRRSRR